MARFGSKQKILPLLWLTAALYSQDARPVRFEVAAVKPSTSTSGPELRIDPGGRFTPVGITLRNLITLAFGIHDEDLARAPSWINSASYDIVAKPADAVNEPTSRKERDRQMLRLQALMRDRFQLRVHWQPEQRRGLVLTAAKSGVRMPEPIQGGCPDSRDGPGLITRMSMFATQLSTLLGERVIDQTGLGGNFCVRLRWTTDEGVPRSLGTARDRSGAPAGAPPVFAALRSNSGWSWRPENCR